MEFTLNKEDIKISTIENRGDIIQRHLDSAEKNVLKAANNGRFSCELLVELSKFGIVDELMSIISDKGFKCELLNQTGNPQPTVAIIIVSWED